MTTPVTVWVIQPGRPWKQPEAFTALLQTTKSGITWALVPRLNGRRFKVGATAFLTLQAAERRRQGKCAQMLAPRTAGYLRWAGLDCLLDASAQAMPPHVYKGQLHL